MSQSKIITQIQHELEQQADEKTKASSSRFFKEDITVHGVTVPFTQAIGKTYFKQLNNHSKKEIFGLCDELWQTGYFEEAIIACNWSYDIKNDYEASDIDQLETWINTYVTNWATCDTLCNHTVGELVDRYPALIKRLVSWTASPNRWVKRAAAVSLIIPARHGKFLPDIFSIADRLLLTPDDLVQKGYGWMLKAASQAHQQQVFDYVMKNRARMPRTALRYAIEKMPLKLRQAAMKK